ELLGEPDDGALRHQRVPLDLPDEPRCLLARQLAGCGPIQIERCISVPLEVGSCDSSIRLLFHGLLDNRCLVLTGSQKDYLTSIEDGAHSHRDGLAGHVFFAKEIAGRILSCYFIKHDEPRSCIRTRARLVETDVATSTNAEQNEIESSRLLDFVLIQVAVGLDLFQRDVSPQHMDVSLGDVDVIEEVLPHE